MYPLVIHGAQRLAALAKVGAITHTTMLVEVGDMAFMQAPVDVEMGHGTVRDALRQIMGTTARYALRNQQHLLIVSTAKVRDRLLTLRLASFSYDSGAVSSFDPLLAEAFREATGCRVMGTAWAGPEVPVHVPRIDVSRANLEDIVASFAESPDASMWIFQTRRRPEGCINDPHASWEIGAYGFETGGSSCQMPFAGAAGPQFVNISPRTHAFLDDCSGVPSQKKSWPPF